MTEQSVFIILAVVSALLIPFVPKVVTFRIKVLRFLRLVGFADWHERNFRAVVIALRSMLVVLAIALLILGVYGH